VACRHPRVGNAWACSECGAARFGVRQFDTVLVDDDVEGSGLTNCLLPSQILLALPEVFRFLCRYAEEEDVCSGRVTSPRIGDIPWVSMRHRRRFTIRGVGEPRLRPCAACANPRYFAYPPCYLVDEPAIGRGWFGEAMSSALLGKDAHDDLIANFGSAVVGPVTTWIPVLQEPLDGMSLESVLQW
jgi:hypothetical protein